MGKFQPKSVIDSLFFVMMKSAVFLLGALAAKCPLRVKSCKSHTVSAFLEKRFKFMTAIDVGVSHYDKYNKFNNTGLYNDLGFRAHDQVAWKIKCPSKYQKVPFAVATSNGLWVRFMQDANSKWQVAENVRVDDFASLNCKKLDNLQFKKLVDIKQEIADSAERCGNKMETSLRECSSFSAKLFLLPDSQFGQDMLAGKPLDTLIPVTKNVYMMIQATVSSLKAHQRRQLNKARVAVFKCGEETIIAWTDIIENEKWQVLVPTKGKSNKSTILLQKVHWSDRCKTVESTV